jgi:TM2 domain-containing membrane protein YozV
MADKEIKEENIENIENVEGFEEIEKKGHTKNWLTTLILCWFLGFLGIHRLYAGKLGSGFLLAYGTVCAACILAVNVYLGAAAFVIVGGFVVNDFLLIATKNFKDCYGNYIVEEKM